MRMADSCNVRRMTLSLLAALAALLPGLAARADAPGTYAIRGARIVTSAGAPIESGTVVIRRGLIDAVGPAAHLPTDPDVELIDGDNLIVYPGLIDLGNAQVAYQPPPRPPQRPMTTAELERWKQRQVLRPQARAADAARASQIDFARLAAAGITSVLALPAGDVVSGQSALISVAAPPRASQGGEASLTRDGVAIVKTPVALHVSFPDRPRAGTSAYPSSLMGVIAFVRQAFLDAQHRARYGRAETDSERADDAALDAMQSAVDRILPVAFEADESREILRALAMARELTLEPIILGGHGATGVAADLKAQKVPVIYSLNYPQRPRGLSPDVDEPIRTLRARADAPKVPAALTQAGVLFAFASAGLTDPKDFLKNAARAVRAGLPPDAAVRALTVDAARIAGVDDRLGTVERGKIANLVVTDGDLFSDSTKVVHVFVEGRPVALAAAR